MVIVFIAVVILSCLECGLKLGLKTSPRLKELVLRSVDKFLQVNMNDVLREWGAVPL